MNMKKLDGNTNLLHETQLTNEILAVVERTAAIREELSSNNYGKHFVAFTDGSCSPTVPSNPNGPGGWAAVIIGPHSERWEVHGSIGETTNNRAEVCGLLAAVASVPEGVYLGIHSDSRYLVDQIRGGYRANDNHDLWNEVREMLAAKNIEVSAAWVPAHSGHRHNERADTLASTRRRNTPARKMRRAS